MKLTSWNRNYLLSRLPCSRSFPHRPFRFVVSYAVDLSVHTVHCITYYLHRVAMHFFPALQPVEPDLLQRGVHALAASQSILTTLLLIRCRQHLGFPLIKPFSTNGPKSLRTDPTYDSSKLVFMKVGVLIPTPYPDCSDRTRDRALGSSRHPSYSEL